ncbi:MAG: hypothetical protein LQ339_004097 [Xanthoria mediterranea]|nr:MAG: hypothetical protein LQ339_004097 [Xanthoria mediterranea]
MASSEMSWTPSSSAKKRKYHEYCDAVSLPAPPHLPGQYPQSPVNYADFGRDMYLGTSTPETRAIYQGVSAPSNAPMCLIPAVPQALRSFLYMVAGVATTAQTYSTYTVGLLAGSGRRFAKCLQHKAAPVFEAIGNTAKRIKLTIHPASPQPTSPVDPQSTPPARRISGNMNLPASVSLPSQTAVLHHARETGLRRVRSTYRWVRDQQHLTEASCSMVEHHAAQPLYGSTNARNSVDITTYRETTSAQDPLTLSAPNGSTAPLDNDGPPMFRNAAVLIDADILEDPSDPDDIHDIDSDINVQIARHIVAAADSVHSSDLDGLDEEDLIGFETKEEKRERMAQQYLDEMNQVKGISNPDLFTEKLRMVCESPKKTVTVYDSPDNGSPVTLVKAINHGDPMTSPFSQQVPAYKSGSPPALTRFDTDAAQGVSIPDEISAIPVTLDEHPSPSSTPSPVSYGDSAVSGSSISDAALATSNKHDTITSRPSSLASLDAVASNLAVLGFSNRQSKKRSSDREAIEQIKRENEAALAAEEAAQLASAEAERQSIEEAKQAKERTRLGIRRRPVGPVIDPLTADWEERLANAMHTGVSSSKSLATTSTGEVLHRRDFGHVLPQHGVDSAMGWLNDTIISAYLQVVVDYAQKSRAVRRGDLPKVHAMNTFFYENLSTRGYESVQRWAARAKFGGRNFLKMETIFVPINKGGNHWVLVHINPQSKTIEYFDSFHHSPGSVFDNIKMWLRQELKDDFVDSEWTLLQNGGPRQRNASDCGVFATTTAKMIVLGVDPMAFSANDMPTQRRRMLAELMNGGLHGDFAPNVLF